MQGKPLKVTLAGFALAGVSACACTGGVAQTTEAVGQPVAVRASIETGPVRTAQRPGARSEIPAQSRA